MEGQKKKTISLAQKIQVTVINISLMVPPCRNYIPIGRRIRSLVIAIVNQNWKRPRSPWLPEQTLDTDEIRLEKDASHCILRI